MKAHNDTNANVDKRELGVMSKERASLVGVSCIVRQYEESRFIVTLPGLPIRPKNEPIHNSQNIGQHENPWKTTNSHGYNLRSSRKYPRLPPKPTMEKFQGKLTTSANDAKNENKPRDENVSTGSTGNKQPNKCVLTEPVLLRIAEQLGNEWQSLLIHLGLKKAQIDHIRSETSTGGDLHQTIFRGLLKWKQRCRKEDQAIHQLQSCLQQVGRNDISQDLDRFDINGNKCYRFQNVVYLQEKVEDLEKRVTSLENRKCNCAMRSTTDTTDGGAEEFEIVSIAEVGLAQDHYYTGSQASRSSIQDWVECGLQRMTTWSYSVEHVHEEETMEIDFEF